MLIIVIYHYEARNFNLYVVASDRVGEPDLLPQLLTHSIGKLGVPVFVFISGWYGLKYRKERFWEMVGMCIFYALISCIGCQLLYGQVRFLELPFSINLWWFMAAYLSIYLLSPGINHFIDTCDKWQVLLAVLTITYISFGDYFVIRVSEEKNGEISFIYHDNPQNEIIIAPNFKEFVSICKSEKIGHIRSIEERKKCLIEAGKGDKITQIKIDNWQKEIDKYAGMHQEEVIID